MYTTLKVDYADGTRQRFNTEPMGRHSARELLLLVFYGQNGTEGAQILSAAFYPKGKGKALHIHREAL